MATYLEAVLLGLIQGITEWLPISSSGHIVIGEYLLGLPQDITLNLVLHAASLVVIYMVFYKDIHQVVRQVCSFDVKQWVYPWYLILGTLPIVLVGLVFNDLIKSLFSIQTVAIALLATAVLLFVSQYPKDKNKVLNWQTALLIGCAQALAILPGVSRSGTTIAVALILGIKSVEAARFSFLLAIPAIVGAVVFEAGSITSFGQPGVLLVGVLVTIVSGWIALKFTLHAISKKYFQHFCWYALVLGLILLLFI